MASYDAHHLSVHLVEACVYHLDFLALMERELQQWHKNPIAVQESVRRYETLWLPLVANIPVQDNCRNAGPLDLLWLWHVHMLSPVHYARDCVQIVGHVVDHALTPLEKTADARLKIDTLWKKQYPTEPMDLNVNFTPQPYHSRLSYNVAAASSRQKSFYYHVSLPHYRDTAFLREAVKRYQKFLHLKKLYTEEFLVPCYDIDLVWHSHQLHPVLYAADCARIRMFPSGEMLPHDDTDTDRSEGSKLNVSDAKTRELWKNVYKENFAKSGCMYRGVPPCSEERSVEARVQPMAEDVLLNLSTLYAQLQVDRAGIQITEPKKLTKFKCIFYEMHMPPGQQPVFDRNRRLHQLSEDDTESSGGNLFTVRVDNSGPRELGMQLYQYRRSFLFQKKELLSTAVLSVSPLLLGLMQRHQYQPTALKNRLDFKSSNMIHASVDLEATLKNSSRGPIKVNVVPGDFLVAYLPVDAEVLWGPVPLSKLPPGVENQCLVATHKLCNQALGVTAAECRVMHSTSLGMSVVQIVHATSRQFLAVGHLLGIDQLPQPSQVITPVPVLNPAKRQRAFLIKDFRGDWGVLVGGWVGMKKGIPGTRQRRGVPGDPGRLELTLYKLRDGKVSSCKVPEEGSDSMTCVLTDLRVDVQNSTIEIPAHVYEDVSALLCVGFAASVLFILCQPNKIDADDKSPQYETATNIQPILDGVRVVGIPKMKKSKTSSAAEKRGARAVKRVDLERMKMCRSAGYGYDRYVPSNSYYIAYQHHPWGCYYPGFCVEVDRGHISNDDNCGVGGDGGDITEFPIDSGDCDGGQVDCDWILPECGGDDGNGWEGLECDTGACGGCGGATDGGGGDTGGCGGCGGCGGGTSSCGGGGTSSCGSGGTSSCGGGGTSSCGGGTSSCGGATSSCGGGTSSCGSSCGGGSSCSS